MLPLCGEICCKDLDLKCVKISFILCFICFVLFFFASHTRAGDVVQAESRAHGWIPYKATVLQLSVHRVKWTLHQMQQMQNVRLRRLKSDQCQGELHTRAVPCFRLISLDHQCQQRFVYMVWSQEKKWDPGFHEQIDPLPPPCYPLTTYLWWCISGISCSLSEWADRIDVFSTWSFPHKKGKPLPPLKQHWKVLFISL